MTDHLDGKELLAMRDIADGQLESADGVLLGRVADVEIGIDDDGRARLRQVVVGPEALAGRISSRLRSPLHRLLHSRFEHTLPLEEIADFGPTLHLRHDAGHYSVGHAEVWVVERILRFIPGNGRSR